MFSLRSAIPTVILIGAAPTYFVFWFSLRLITFIGSLDYVYRLCDDYLYSLYQRFVLFFFENWTHVKIYFHGDYNEIITRKENVLYLSNHRSSVDWIIANMLAVRQGSLGHIRYVLKSALKWIPLYGFYFQQHGCIYVRRNDKRDIERVEKGIGEIKSNGLPVWLVIFPEGTRYNLIKNPEAIERSCFFARQKGLSPFEHVLYPRMGATVAAINALKNEFDAVYDVTVVYYDEHVQFVAPSMFEYLQGQVKELHIYIERIPMASIPSTTNEQISNWLYQRFLIKDNLLKDFSQLREKGLQVQLNLSITVLPCILFLLTTLICLITSQGRSIYWQICFFGVPLTLLWVHLFSPSESID